MNKKIAIWCRKYATTILLILSVVVGELHNFFTDDPKRCANWILKIYRPMTIAWNVKYIEAQILPIIYWFSLILFKWNKINVTTVKTLLVFFIIDAIMYFYNYKTDYFGSVYVWIFFIWVFIYFFKPADKWMSGQHYLFPKK